MFWSRSKKAVPPPISIPTPANADKPTPRPTTARVDPHAEQDAADSRAQQQRLNMKLKILVLGGAGVGRSSFIRKYEAMYYAQPPQPTQTVDVHTFGLGDFRVGDPFPPNLISLELCDVAPHMLHTGTTQLSSLMSNVDGVLLLADHHETSLVAVDAWRACLAAYTSCQTIPMLLVITKSDLDSSPYPSSVLDSYCTSSGLMGHISMTSKSRPSCEAVIDQILTEAIIRKMAREREQRESDQEHDKDQDTDIHSSSVSSPSSAAFVTSLSAIPNYHDIHPITTAATSSTPLS